MWRIGTDEVIGSDIQAALFGLHGRPFFKNFKAWEKSVHPDDLGKIKDELKQSVDEKKPLDTEFRIVWPDKSIHWMLSKAYPYFDAHGNPEKMVGVNINITERKLMLEAIAESEKRFHAMSDNAPVMIWISDANQQCTFVNKTWFSFTGRTMEKEIGKGWYQGLHPEDSEMFLEVYNQAYEAQREFKIDYRLKRHDGQYRWIMNNGIPRYADGAIFAGFIGTCVDIHERINLERQKDDFMGIASHELKTPVTSIKAYAQILQEKFRKANDMDSAGMLGRLDNQIDKLTNLINTLLDVARIQTEQMDYDEEFFEIDPFIEDVTEEVQRIFPSHKINKQLNAKGKLFGDRSRLSQVLNNLISNAVKYSPDSNEIIVSTERDENDFIITVQDFGVGIPKDMQEQIFERFYRISESSGNRVSGLGLGLFISSQIIKQQGGRIWLESDPGKGSRFSFSLPYKSQA